MSRAPSRACFRAAVLREKDERQIVGTFCSPSWAAASVTYLSRARVRQFKVRPSTASQRLHARSEGSSVVTLARRCGERRKLMTHATTLKRSSSVTGTAADVASTGDHLEPPADGASVSMLGMPLS